MKKPERILQRVCPVRPVAGGGRHAVDFTFRPGADGDIMRYPWVGSREKQDTHIEGCVDVMVIYL